MSFRPVKRDPTLPHQILIATRSSVLRMYVSCNCRKRPLESNYDPIADVVTYYEAAKAYNDPDNHRRPFGERDKVRLG